MKHEERSLEEKVALTVFFILIGGILLFIKRVLMKE